MGGVIGDVLPFAAGVAISPMPIIAVILMLLAPRAGAASAGFLTGWVTGIVAGVTVVTVLAITLGFSTSGGGSTAGAIVKLVLGAALLLLALKQWRSRPRGDGEAPVPKWLSALDSVTAVKATGLGFALAAVNPKNLLMILAAGVTIGQARQPVGQIAIVIAVFSVIAASTVAAPVIIYRVERVRAQGWLGTIKTWLVANNATVMMVLFALIGVVLIGKGVSGL